MYPDRKKFVLEPFMLIPIFSGKSYMKKVLSIDPANLAVYFLMNEASGLTADNTEGTGARDGTYSGVTLGQPGIGDGNTCPYFDGVNDLMHFGTASLETACISDEMTIACWAKVANVGVWTDSTVRYVMGFTYGAATDAIIMLKSATDNRLQWQAEWGNGGPKPLLINGISETGWMHLAATLSVASDEFINYYNGVAQSTQTGFLTQSDFTIDAVRTIVGARVWTPADPWLGWLAHAAIWTSVLTPAQIADLATV
jgi:hypothetical protein